jgi:2-oxoglutarate ferredoxin oxidoreductase subunit delta
MAKGEIVISEERCKGCGLCEHFCARGCISLAGGKLAPKGYIVPIFIAPDQCTGCGICGWLCPDFAIEVYQYIESKTPSAG